MGAGSPFLVLALPWTCCVTSADPVPVSCNGLICNVEIVALDIMKTSDPMATLLGDGHADPCVRAFPPSLAALLGTLTA